MPRQRDTSPEERLLETARRLFMEYGVASVSTEMLAKEAQVSKSSLYRYFGGVPELFAAIIDENSRVFEMAPDLDFVSKAEFLARVAQFGHDLSKLLARDDIRKMTFAVMTHSARDRATAELFFNRAIEAARLNLIRLLEAGRAKGFLESSVSTRRLATYLLSVWDG
ncbi:MAG: helix-turn-helix domain-containing protein, partial [Myxococcota bacterium]